MPKMKLSPDVRALNPGIEIPASPKYGNEKTEVDGIAFDSKAEAARYGELRLLEQAGAIRDLSPAPGAPRQRFAIGAGRFYIPDFVYFEGFGQMVAEDVKGKTAKITDLSSLKMALFREKYPEIELRIVRC